MDVKVTVFYFVGGELLSWVSPAVDISLRAVAMIDWLKRYPPHRTFEPAWSDLPRGGYGGGN